MMPGGTLPAARRGPRAVASLAGTSLVVPSAPAAAPAVTSAAAAASAVAAQATRPAGPAVASLASPSQVVSSSAVASLAAVAPAVASPSVAVPAARSAGPAVASWPALGTVAALAVTDPMRLPAASELLAAEIAAVDAACSSFRADSELAAVNATARRRGGPVPVSPLLAGAIGAALLAAEQTSGDLDPVAGTGTFMAHAGLAAGQTGGQTGDQADPATGPGSFAAHRVRVSSRLRTAGGKGLLTVAACASWRQVRLDAGHGLLSLPPGSWLDLGATAKAWAADRAAASIAARLGCGVLVSLGGDVATCGAAPLGGWRIRVQDNAAPAAGQPALPAAAVSIRTGGLATAGVGAARWRCGGDVLAHMLRPRGGTLTASPWRLASVTARLVETGGRVRTIAGWPADLAELSGSTGQPALPAMITATFGGSSTENSPRSRIRRPSCLAGAGAGGAAVPR